MSGFSVLSGGRDPGRQRRSCSGRRASSCRRCAGRRPAHRPEIPGSQGRAGLLRLHLLERVIRLVAHRDLVRDAHRQLKPVAPVAGERLVHVLVRSARPTGLESRCRPHALTYWMPRPVGGRGFRRADAQDLVTRPPRCRRCAVPGAPLAPVQTVPAWITFSPFGAACGRHVRLHGNRGRLSAVG